MLKKLFFVIRNGFKTLILLNHRVFKLIMRGTYAVSQKKVKVTRLCSSAMVQCFVNLCSKSTLGLLKKLFLKKERYGESCIARVFQ